MTFDPEKLLEAIVENSQATEYPLELVMLDDCLCLRVVSCKSWTLTAGSRGEPRKESCQRILSKIAAQAKKKNSMMFYDSRFGISPFKSFSELIMQMSVKGLY